MGFHSALAGAAVNIYSFFSPPPQAGDGEKKVPLYFCTISTSKTKQGFVYSSGAAEGQEEKGVGRMMLLRGSAGIKHLFSQSGHLSPFQTSLKGVAASPLVFQNGNPFSRWAGDGNSCPGFRKQIIYPFPFPLMALLALPVPFHQRGRPHGAPSPHEGCTGLNLPGGQRTAAAA